MKKHLLVIMLLLLQPLLLFSPTNNNSATVENIDVDVTETIMTADFPDDIGYDFLEDGDVLHIWNTEDNYYFDVDSGLQLTNHYNQYWTHNVMMLGYFTGVSWNLLYRTDELSGFSKTIDTDNSTYINITMWKDLSYGAYDFRFALVYYLELNDRNLTVIPYIKNLGIEIPHTLAFGWELKDIKIDNDKEYDQIYIDSETCYSLHGTLDESYTGTDTDGVFYLQNNISGHLNKDLYLRWNPSLDYLLKVKSKGGQYNAPVTLYIQIGTLAVGQEKLTKMYWHDSSEIIRPDGTGVIYEWDYQNLGGGASANNWNRVDEAVHDASTTQVVCNTDTDKDVHSFDDTTARGTITNVEAHCYGNIGGVGASGDIRFVCYVDSTYYYSGVRTINYGVGADFDYEDTGSTWANNPSGGAWTWDDVDDAQFGYELDDTIFQIYITQLYVTVTYTPDTSPPTPNPMTWDSEPTTDSTTQISMSCNQASDVHYDNNELSYQFNETTGGSGATDSGWQLDDLTYTDSGLAENTNYTYHVRSKDGEPNIGTYSESITTSTWATAPSNGEFTIDDYESSYINMSVLDVDNNATENLTGAYFECMVGGGDGGDSSGWTNITSGGRYYYNDTGLDGGTTFGYRVKYRNIQGVETAWTSQKQQSTTDALHYNETTNIGENSATFHGYLTDDPVFDGTYTCGFWYGLLEGQDSSEGEIFASGTYSRGEEFTTTATDLLEGKTYYVRSYIHNITHYLISSEKDFFTKPTSPTSIDLSIVGDSNVSMVWTRATTNASATTVIVRKGYSYPENPDDGTVVYNDTGTSFTDNDSVLAGAVTYYRIWNHLNPFSEGNVSGNISLPPLAPTDISSEILGNSSFNIEWTKGLGADTTLVIKKTDGFPTSITDGTVVYNDTGLEVFDEDVSFGATMYYSLWSFANGSYSSKVDVTQGGLVINCFSEEGGSPLEFDVFISNEEGTDTYEALNQTNPLIINTSNTPHGDKCSIRISSAEHLNNRSESFTYSNDENETITYVILQLPPMSKRTTNVSCINTSSSAVFYPAFTVVDDTITILGGACSQFDKITTTYVYSEYRERLYYLSLYNNTLYLLEAYLPPTDGSNLYQMSVIDEFNQPIQNALMTFKRYIGDEFKTISTLFTSAQGTTELYLMDGEQYKIIITKEGYQTEIADIVTDIEIRSHTFKLLFDGSIPEPDYSFFHNLTFTIEPDIYQHNPYQNLYFNISSSDNLILWMSANIYYYNTTLDDENVTIGWEIVYSENITNSPSGGSIHHNISGQTGRYSFVCAVKKSGFPIYVTTQEYWLYHNVIERVEDFPDEVWLIITIVLMLVTMGFLAKFGAGAMIGVGGIIVMGIMFSLKPDMVIGGISAWWILLTTTIVYVILIYLMRGK